MATIHSDLKGIDLSKYPSKMRSGRRMYMVSFQVRISVGLRRGVLCFASYFNDEELGVTTASFDSEDEGGEGQTYEAGEGCAVQ